MIVLVVNAGSTSLKLDVFDMPGERCLASATVQRIGKADATVEIGGDDIATDREVREIDDHEDALTRVLDSLLSHFEIAAVGHRIVHGGEDLTEPALIDRDVEHIIEKCSRFAPLHNPANLAGVRAARGRLPELPQIAVTDTGFHRTLPPASYLYALPYDLYETHGVRRYGFHGTSHQYVASEAARFLARPIEDLGLISCHLGGGASVCAIQNGRSIATSMGMTPLEGLVMGTRSGDIDAGILFYLQQQLSMSVAEVDRLLNRESGLLGISGVSRDMREIVEASAQGNRRASLAIDLFCQRLRQYVGAYMAQLGGADAVVFTGGIGENAAAIRAKALENLSALGLDLDKAANFDDSRAARSIASSASRVAVLVIPTDEELQIAREVYRLLDVQQTKDR